MTLSIMLLIVVSILVVLVPLVYKLYVRAMVELYLKKKKLPMRFLKALDYIVDVAVSTAEIAYIRGQRLDRSAYFLEVVKNMSQILLPQWIKVEYCLDLIEIIKERYVEKLPPTKSRMDSHSPVD